MILVGDVVRMWHGKLVQVVQTVHIYGDQLVSIRADDGQHYPAGTFTVVTPEEAAHYRPPRPVTRDDQIDAALFALHLVDTPPTTPSFATQIRRLAEPLPQEVREGLLRPLDQVSRCCP